MSQLLDLRRPVMVTLESFSHMRDAKLISEDGSIFEITLINCNEISRNRTYYGLDDVMKSLDTSRQIQEAISQKLWMGEAEHPSSLDGKPLPLKRLMQVLPEQWVWRIDKYWAEGDKIKGHIQLLDSGKYGPMYKELITKHGANIAASIRAYTPNFVLMKDSAGAEYTMKKHQMHIATFDAVRIPGLEGARIMDPTKYAQITKNGGISVKSMEGFQEIQYENAVAELRDTLRSEEGASFLSDFYGINYDNADMVLSGRNTLTVGTESGSRIDMPLDGTMLSKILG